MDSYKSPRLLISVIIPTFNSEDYLEATIDSVLGQKGIGSVFEIEVIIVDDGSTDGTKNVLEKYRDRVSYLKIVNSGRPAVPRNIGAKMAKGEYLAFLDSDDIWMPNKLKSQIKILMQDIEVVLVSSNANKIDATGGKLGERVVPPRLLPRESNFDELVKNNFVCTSATVVRRESFERAGGFDEKLDLKAVEDYELWLRISTQGKIIYQDSPTILYRVHGGNISKADPLLASQQLVRVYKSVYGKVDQSYRCSILKALAFTYYSMADSSGGVESKLYKFASKITALKARLLYN